MCFAAIVAVGRAPVDERLFLAEGRLDSGWCQDLATVQGAWGHAGVRFSLVGVSLSLLFLCFPTFLLLLFSFVDLDAHGTITSHGLFLSCIATSAAPAVACGL